MKRTILSLALAAVTALALSGPAQAGYSDSVLWNGLYQAAEALGFATPDIEDPANPGSLSEAVELTQWKNEFLSYAADNLSHLQCYEIARQVGFRVQRVDPNNSLQDAVIYTRWLGAFKRYMAEKADFEDTVVAISHVIFVGA